MERYTFVRYVLRMTPKPKRATAPLIRFRPDTTALAIGRSALLDALSPFEVVIYLRLVAMSDAGRVIAPKNRELYRDGRTTRNVLASLERRNLIKMSERNGGREIWVER